MNVTIVNMDTTLRSSKYMSKRAQFIFQVQPIAPATGSTTISTSGGNNVAGGGKVPGRSRAMLRSGGGDSAVPLIMDDSSATTASQVTNRFMSSGISCNHRVLLAIVQYFNLLFFRRPPSRTCCWRTHAPGRARGCPSSSRGQSRARSTSPRLSGRVDSERLVIG